MYNVSLEITLIVKKINFKSNKLLCRLSGKQDDSLERQSDSSESWSDILERQEF